MLLTPIVEVIAGTTLRATWVNSGVAPSSLSSALLDSTDAVISTYVAVSSGNGHYYAVHYIPDTPTWPWFINRWISFIEGNTYQNRQLVRAHKLEV